MKHTIRPNQERACQHQESKISTKLRLGPQLPTAPLMLQRNRESRQEMGNVPVLQVWSWLAVTPAPKRHPTALGLGAFGAPVAAAGSSFSWLLPSPAGGWELYLLLAAFPMGPSYPCHVDP